MQIEVMIDELRIDSGTLRRCFILEPLTDVQNIFPAGEKSLHAERIKVLAATVFQVL